MLIKYQTGEMQMHPLKHLFTITFRVIKYIFLYLALIALFIGIFGFIYSKQSMPAPFEFSLDVLWGSPLIPKSAKFIVIIQRITNDVLLVLFLGTFISQQIKPVNPIKHSKYIALCPKVNECFFRYWVLLPEGKYLFDAKVRLVITDSTELNRGVNKLTTVFEKEHFYNSIRGVRYFKLTGPEVSEFSNIINEESLISLYVIGTNETGITYSSVKRYKINDVKKGYRFVSIRETEYLEQAESVYGEGNQLPCSNSHQEKSCKRKKELMKYYHFDKLYRTDKDCDEINEKDVLDKEKIINGQYKGPIKWVLDLYSWFTSVILDRTNRNLEGGRRY